MYIRYESNFSKEYIPVANKDVKICLPSLFSEIVYVFHTLIIYLSRRGIKSLLLKEEGI